MSSAWKHGKIGDALSKIDEEIQHTLGEICNDPVFGADVDALCKQDVYHHADRGWGYQLIKKRLYSEVLVTLLRVPGNRFTAQERGLSALTSMQIENHKKEMDECRSNFASILRTYHVDRFGR